MSVLERNNTRVIEHLELLAKQVVEGFIIGLHKSPFHGFSVEFAEHRLYNPGESTKNIDWKVLARTDKMFVKRYEEETNLRCQIVVDTSSSMYFPLKEGGGKQFNKLEFSALAAASLMNLLRKQRDAFGLSLFDQELSVHTPCKSNTGHYKLLLSYLEKELGNYRDQQSTSAASALHQIADRIHKRSLVVIFSDMFERQDDVDSMFSALQHLKYNKHEVILFHVTDHQLEEQFEYENRPYLFVDMESGEEIKLQSDEVKKMYQEKVKAYKSALVEKCQQYRIDFIDTDINGSYDQILQNYLIKRSKMKV